MSYLLYMCMNITENLLLRFLKCETSSEEELAILDWLDADPENIKALDKLDFQFNATVMHAHQTQQKPEKKSMARRVMQYVSIAAAAAILAVVNGMYQSYKTRAEVENLTASVEVPSGHRISMTMQDGTRVWLNSGSSMEYPAVFGKDNRSIKLSGEAMFDVMKDQERPFVIETFACNVKVLGTKFNVTADPSSGTFSTALLQGMVQITAKESDSELILKPGEKAELINGRLRKSRITNPDEYLWTDGIISLQSNSFGELLDKLEKAYDVRFVVRREQMPVVHCKGKIRVSDGIEHAMEILKLGTEFDYEINHSSNEIYIY